MITINASLQSSWIQDITKRFSLIYANLKKQKVRQALPIETLRSCLETDRGSEETEEGFSSTKKSETVETDDIF